MDVETGDEKSLGDCFVDPQTALEPAGPLAAELQPALITMMGVSCFIVKAHW